jgi:nucleotide-binding universal stress UspA family protein
MRVLLATDGSESAGVAVDLVAGMAWPDRTAVRVVQAVETTATLTDGPWPALYLLQADTLEADARQAAEASVEAVRRRLERPGLTVSTAVLVGRPSTAVVDAGRATEADLIVVGSRGHGTIATMLLGSVSQEVVDHAPMPVLVARRPAIGKVLLAWDGSDSARRAADLVATWPFFRGLSVRVVSVADIGVPWWTGFPASGSPQLTPMYVEAAEASHKVHGDLARQMAAELTDAGLRATPELREGDAAGEIIAAANTSDADLIVLGTHGWTGVRRFVLGSVARNVLHHASASILVVRAPAADLST